VNTQEIIIVSGLPRSGTSLMMQMLAGGGLDLLTDGARAADVDNPRGYFEAERVKAIRRDSSWLPQARGKAIKMVSLLLYDLPAGEKYRILFMERDLGEVIASQRMMLLRLNKPPGDDNEQRRFFELHLAKLHAWLPQQANMEILRVAYNDLLEQPLAESQRICEFLGGGLDSAAMAGAVDETLYRNRKQGER
jgi:hypothetical protein